MGIYTFYMHVGRDINVLIARRLYNGWYHVYYGLSTHIVHFKDNLAKLAALNDSILVVIDETCIANIQRRSIGETLGELLYTGLFWHVGLWLLGTIGSGIVTRLEVINAIISTVGSIKSTTIVRGVCCHWFGDGRRHLVTAITRDHSLSITVMVRRSIVICRGAARSLTHTRSPPLVSCLTYGCTNCCTTSHAYNGANIRTTGATGDATYS